MNYMTPQKSLRLVSFDSGGPGCISQLQMLEEVIARLAWDLCEEADLEDLRPAKYIDLMAGTGWGAFCALLLGRLGMSVDETISAVATVAQTVFPLDQPHGFTAQERSNCLKKSIEDLLRQYNWPIDLPLKEAEGQLTSSTHCKVIVFAQPTAALHHSQAFRTYTCRNDSNLNCTFLEAACAVLSSPSLFSPVMIGPSGREHQFAGPPYGSYNPAGKIVSEAGRIFSTQHTVSLLLSLGAGQPHFISLNRNSQRASESTIVQVVEDCDYVDEQIFKRLPKLPTYLRLSVDKGLEDYKLEYWHCLGDIIARTRAYLYSPVVSNQIEKALTLLIRSHTLVTLEQINGPVFLNQPWDYFHR